MLNRITIKNYKSLKELSLELRPLMVFIGPNNSGKSNILGCFQFLSEFVKTEGAVRKWGGFEQFVFDGNINQTIYIELQGSVKIKNKEREYIYFEEGWKNSGQKR